MDGLTKAGPPGRTEQVAAVLARLCHEFFISDEPDPLASLELQQPRWRRPLSSRQWSEALADLQAEALDIRARGTELGLSWTLEHQPNVSHGPHPAGGVGPVRPVRPRAVRGHPGLRER